MNFRSEIILRVKVDKGRLVKYSKEVLEDNITTLIDGEYDIKGKKAKGYENPSRYKYYWSGFLPSIFSKMNSRYWVLEKGGQRRNPVDLIEFHHHLRCEFCRYQVINEETDEIMNVPVSTTILSDNAFITEFQDRIAEIAVNDYSIEIEMYEDWRGRYELKNTSIEDKKELLNLLKSESTEKEIKQHFKNSNKRITSYAIEYARMKLGVQF